MDTRILFRDLRPKRYHGLWSPVLLLITKFGINNDNSRDMHSRLPRLPSPSFTPVASSPSFALQTCPGTTSQEAQENRRWTRSQHGAGLQVKVSPKLDISFYLQEIEHEGKRHGYKRAQLSYQCHPGEYGGNRHVDAWSGDVKDRRQEVGGRSICGGAIDTASLADQGRT
jgi:hypothetical protein